MFEKGDSAKNHCAIGSVKSAVGHLEIAAGITSFIKTTLALKNRTLPASLHFKSPNPQIDFENSPFYVVNQTADWKTGNSPRRAGVSAFGVGGTNAHVVLQEAAESTVSDSAESRLLPVCVSARTPEALAAGCRRLADCLENDSSLSLREVAETLLHGRTRFDVRCSVAARDSVSAVAALRSVADRHAAFTKTGNADESVVFSFPGQGSQHLGMARNVYEQEPVFRECFDQCCELLRPDIGLDLRELVFGEGDDQEVRSATLQETRITQPALFAVEYSLARLWIARGVKPASLVGHSVGEYVAACLAGVFSLEDGLKLIAARGRFIQEQPHGAMLVVRKGAAEVEAMLPKDLVIATDNSPTVCVVAGSHEAVDAFADTCGEREIVVRKLATSHAFHSPMVAAAGDRLAEAFRGVELHAPTIPLVSNLSGGWMSASEATDPEYWADHLRRAVRFSVCIETLIEDGFRVFLECGPGRGLSGFVNQHANIADSPLFAINSLTGAGSDDDDHVALWEAMGRLWQAGGAVDWTEALGGDSGRRVHLPTYAFERKRFWVDPPVSPKTADVVSKMVGIGRDSSNLEEKDDSRSSTGAGRKPVVEMICEAFTEISGIEIAPEQTGLSFLELGFDSLFLTQASQQIKRRFGKTVSFKQLMDDLNTVDLLAEFLGEQVGAVDSSTSRFADKTPTADGQPEDMKAIFERQLESMEEQLDLMQKLMDENRCERVFATPLRS